MKSVWLIHNNIPPYRVPLFSEIAKRADFNFTVVLTAPKCKHRLHWQTKTELMPFKVLTMKGLNFAMSDDDSVSISFGLLPSLIHKRPGIVICCGFGLSTLMVFVYASIFGRPYIVWSESTPVTEGIRRIGHLRQWSRRLLARHASAFIDAGTLAREYIRSLLPASSQTPFFRSYNCVDKSLFSSSDNSDDSKPGQLRKILFIGRLNQNKGIPMLLDVYGDVLEKSVDRVGLVLIGDGPLRHSVKQYSQKQARALVELHGQIAYTQVAKFYAGCDVLVLLSLSDCNPLVVLEALHAGIPIICTDRAGNAPDFIVPGENGYIVDPTNKDQIVSCMMEVLQWDPARRAMCRRVSQAQVTKANYRDSAAAFITACEVVFSNSHGKSVSADPCRLDDCQIGETHERSCG